ncbi:glycosyltransferase [Fulvivirga sediminis]|uniref:Glycosyltransferase n=1 Tax=Fulvivirga sediminis TaxID=2803949 RepID=A0A937FD83_9BACT|nr:glycosyltransferase [Fulvivirga sediminis]MBL3658624.1 glycosyltransferase [Fulvivirga sediminis]
MTVLLTALTCICASLLLFSSIVTILSLIANPKKPTSATEERDMALIITAYKSVDLVPQLLSSIYRSNYSNYHVYVVADDCQDCRDIEENPKLTVLKPATALSSKLKSIKYAVTNYVRNHDTSIVLDSDNLVHRDFLAEMNDYRECFKAVQGRRVAKNLDTFVASLDEMGEIYHNYVDKYAPYKLGSSSNLSGSGMAFSTSLLESFLFSEEVEQLMEGVIYGEDKLFANFIVEKGHQIAYHYDALVYDEKLEKKDQIKRQRIRWFKSYFINLQTAASLAGVGLLKGRVGSVFFGVVSAFPPLFLLVLGTGLLTLIAVFFNPWLSLILVGAAASFVFNFLFVLWLTNAPKPVWNALVKIPLFMFEQLKAMLVLHRHKGDFLVTQHSKSVNVEEVN